MVNWITVCVASTAILIGIALYIFRRQGAPDGFVMLLKRSLP